MNIVTKRTYQDGSIGLAINGRDIPDTMMVEQNSDGSVYIRMQCAVFNDLQGDEAVMPHNHTPGPDFKPVRGTLMRDSQGNTVIAPPKLTWRQRFERWINRG